MVPQGLKHQEENLVNLLKKKDLIKYWKIYIKKTIFNINFITKI